MGLISRPLSPTVPQGQERLRFCLHSYNTPNEQIEEVLVISNFLKTVIFIY
jgi:8-amino-7-oxononanoate synthase